MNMPDNNDEDSYPEYSFSKEILQNWFTFFLILTFCNVISLIFISPLHPVTFIFAIILCICHNYRKLSIKFPHLDQIQTESQISAETLKSLQGFYLYLKSLRKFFNLCILIICYTLPLLPLMGLSISTEIKIFVIFAAILLVIFLGTLTITSFLVIPAILLKVTTSIKLYNLFTSFEQIEEILKKQDDNKQKSLEHDDQPQQQSITSFAEAHPLETQQIDIVESSQNEIISHVLDMQHQLSSRSARLLNDIRYLFHDLEHQTVRQIQRNRLEQQQQHDFKKIHDWMKEYFSYPENQRTRYDIHKQRIPEIWLSKQLKHLRDTLKQQLEGKTNSRPHMKLKQNINTSPDDQALWSRKLQKTDLTPFHFNTQQQLKQIQSIHEYIENEISTEKLEPQQIQLLNERQEHYFFALQNLLKKYLEFPQQQRTQFDSTLQRIPYLWLKVQLQQHIHQLLIEINFLYENNLQALLDHQTFLEQKFNNPETEFQIIIPPKNTPKL